MISAFEVKGIPVRRRVREWARWAAVMTGAAARRLSAYPRPKRDIDMAGQEAYHAQSIKSFTAASGELYESTACSNVFLSWSGSVNGSAQMRPKWCQPVQAGAHFDGVVVPLGRTGGGRTRTRRVIEVRDCYR